jgi:hypothetical protein
MKQNPNVNIFNLWNIKKKEESNLPAGLESLIILKEQSQEG